MLLAPNPVPEDAPKPDVVGLDVPNRPVVDAEVDCDPKRPLVGLFPNKPVPSPLVCVLPKGVDDELAAPKGLLVVAPKPVVPKPPKLLVPKVPVPPVPVPNLRPAA